MNSNMIFATVLLLCLYSVHFCWSAPCNVTNYEEESKKIFVEFGIVNPTPKEKELVREIITQRNEKSTYKNNANEAWKQVGIVEAEKNKTTDAAAKLEFLLLYRNKLVYIEEHYCPWMPLNDNQYLGELFNLKIFANFRPDDLPRNKHSKKWLWILVFGDATQCTQINTLRSILKYDVARYIWFANQAQKMFELLSDDNHLEGRMLDVNYLKKDQVTTYISFLNPDLQEAAKIFFTSEGWLPLKSK